VGAVAGAIRLVLGGSTGHGIQDALAVGDAIAAADVDRGEALGAAALVAVAGVAGSGVRDELAEELVEGVSGEGVRDVDAGIFLAARSWSWSERCPFSLVSAAREAVALKLVESEGWTCTSGSSLLASDFFPHRGVHSHELVGHRVQHQLPCVGPGRLVHGGAPAEVVMALCILRVLAGALGPGVAVLWVDGGVRVLVCDQHKDLPGVDPRAEVDIQVALLGIRREVDTASSPVSSSPIVQACPVKAALSLAAEVWEKNEKRKEKKMKK